MLSRAKPWSRNLRAPAPDGRNRDLRPRQDTPGQGEVDPSRVAGRTRGRVVGLASRRPARKDTPGLPRDRLRQLSVTPSLASYKSYIAI